MARAGTSSSPDGGRSVRNARPRDRLGRPLPYGDDGVALPPRPEVLTPTAALDEAQRLLDAGLPFHAHEVLEDQWKAAHAAERDLWRGLAQLAVGLTHAARGNARGADALLRRGIGLVRPYASAAPYGLDVPALVAWTEHATEQVAGEGVVTSVPPLRRAR